MDALTRLRKYLIGDPVQIMSIEHVHEIMWEIEGKDARIQDLLEANNRYLERARRAEDALEQYKSISDEMEGAYQADLAAERERAKALEDELDLREQEDCNEENYMQSEVDKLTASLAAETARADSNLAMGKVIQDALAAERERADKSELTNEAHCTVIEECLSDIAKLREAMVRLCAYVEVQAQQMPSPPDPLRRARAVLAETKETGMSISASDYKAAWEKAEQEIERLRAALAAERESKKSYMQGEIAEYERAEKAVEVLGKARECIVREPRYDGDVVAAIDALLEEMSNGTQTKSA